MTDNASMLDRLRDKKTTYDSIRSYVMSYEVVTSSWSTSKVHSELGVVGSYAPTSNSGPSPMEIDAVTLKR